MAGRFLDATLGDPAGNLALEEALFRAAASPLLRTWDNQTSVVLGRAQLAEAETDLEYCDAAGIPVLRRFTAGGAVYNGPGNTNWTFVVPRNGSSERLSYSSDAKEVFRSFAGVVVAALRACSFVASFDPPNRIVDSSGRKISGMAAYISDRAAMCHGTMLLGADLALLRRVTTPAAKAPARRYPRSRPAEVANCGVGRDRFVEALRSASGGFEPSAPTAVESALAARLVTERYSRREWNLGDPFSLDYR